MGDIAPKRVQPQGAKADALIDLISAQSSADLEIVRSDIANLTQAINDLDANHPQLAEVGKICMFSRALATNYLSAFLDQVNLPSEELHQRVEEKLSEAVDVVWSVRKRGGPLTRNQVTLKYLRQYYWNETARLNRTRELRFGLQSFLDRLACQREGMGMLKSPLFFRVVTPSSNAVENGNSQLSGVQIPISDRLTLIAFALQRLHVEASNFLLEIRLEAGPYRLSAGQQYQLAERIHDRAEGLFRSVNVDPKVRAVLGDFTRIVVQPLNKAAEARDETSAKMAFENLKGDEQIGILYRLSQLYKQSISELAVESLPVGRQESISRKELSDLLSEIDHVSEISKLEAALDSIIEVGLAPEEGVLPDSAALAVLKRLGEIAPQRFVEYLRRMLALEESHFRPGYFGTSLMGVVMANLSDEIEDEVRKIVHSELKKLAGCQMLDDPAQIGFLASLTAVFILLEKTNEPEAARQLQEHLQRVNEKMGAGQERTVFYQSLLEILKYRISNKNISQHFLQLTQLYQNLNGDLLLWPDTPLFKLLSGHLMIDARR